ncbi:MAG: DUF885 family protein, partial [Blastocatellia bacterium]|nr:DUF885 family protein [Blastocatellia bacterium]
LYPIYATQIGDSRYDDRFENDIGEEHRAKAKGVYDRYLKALSGIDRSRVIGKDRLSYDQFKFETEASIEGYKYSDHLVPINQFQDTTSFFAELASGKSLHPFKTVKNYDDFLARIQGFQVWVDTAVENMRKGTKLGIVQPRVLMEKKLSQIDALLLKDEKSISISPYRILELRRKAEREFRLKFQPQGIP